MTITNRDELLATLNELLEAERAGARVALHTFHEAPAESKALLMSIHRDEARWCGVLGKAILHFKGEPSRNTGAFYDKAIAIGELSERLRFLNRGQGWVVRKLETLLPAIDEATIRAELTEMLDSHKTNIQLVVTHVSRPENSGRDASDASMRP